MASVVKAASKAVDKEGQVIKITPPNFQEVRLRIRGRAPYVQNKFSQKAREEIRYTQEQGQRSKKGAKREPKDFQTLYEGAKHIAYEGWCGLPAPAFRNAMVSACRTVGFAMTLAKLGVFVHADGFDRDDHTPLVRIVQGDPEYFEAPVKNADKTCDLRARPLWRPGWEAIVRIRYDADMFSLSDICNLMARVGDQVGIGEGRPDSPKSCGMGWGLFDVIEGAATVDG